MTRSRRSVMRAVVFGFAGAAGMVDAAVVATAADPNAARIFKPLAGVSLGVGSKRVVGYFASVAGACQLTLMIADEMVGDEPPADAPVRLVQTVSPDATAVVDTPEGKSLEFGCRQNATAMTVWVLGQMATYKVTK